MREMRNAVNFYESFQQLFLAIRSLGLVMQARIQRRNIISAKTTIRRKQKMGIGKHLQHGDVGKLAPKDKPDVSIRRIICG